METDTAQKFLDKVGEIVWSRILDRLFAYQEMAQAYYPQRNNNPEALGLAIAACGKQISPGPNAAKAFLEEYPRDSLPAHTGLNQLSIIRERDKGYSEAIRLCNEAISKVGEVIGSNV